MPSPTNLPPLKVYHDKRGGDYVVIGDTVQGLTEAEALLVIHRSNTQPGLLGSLNKAVSAMSAHWRMHHGSETWIDDKTPPLVQAIQDAIAAIEAAEKGVA